MFTYPAQILKHLCKMKLIFVTSLFVSIVFAYPIEEYNVYKSPGVLHTVPVAKEEPAEYPRYHFEYGVQDGDTGDIKEQTEERDGDVVRGEYSLVEPDGTIRKVQYQDDGQSGFNAIVTRTGHAIHPPPQPQGQNVVAVPVHYAGYHT